MGNLTGDEMLVNEIKAGNALAFEAMVIKYQPKLLSSLIAYTKSHDQAEELCQKTFIRVWQKIDTFRGDSALFTWIYRIGINLAKNDFASSYAKSKKKTGIIGNTSTIGLNKTYASGNLAKSKLSIIKTYKYIKINNIKF